MVKPPCSKFTANGPGHAETCLTSYANNNCADQPAHSRSLISTFVVCCLDSTTLVAIFETSRLQLPSVAEQAGLNLTWSKISETLFRVMCLKRFGCPNLQDFTIIVINVVKISEKRDLSAVRFVFLQTRMHSHS